jgi:peroxiredoxin Q/BCP
VQILGCSFDTVEENKAFADKFGYGFPLLCDTERKVGVAYGACTSPQSGFADRISFLIDEKGNIAAAFPKVSPASHPKEILALLGGHD